MKAKKDISLWIKKGQKNFWRNFFQTAEEISGQTACLPMNRQAILYVFKIILLRRRKMYEPYFMCLQIWFISLFSYSILHLSVFTSLHNNFSTCSTGRKKCEPVFSFCEGCLFFLQGKHCTSSKIFS
ncbi:Uncharacterized protein dnm_044000 [Desulfonema magnum]|uniref:Uncharacterized protein n=1 Tax=Desulfonema magnum TaxID=45655 RepID=A0A975BMT5_9BACT|nr:Uncharacterized protein dnm_044000 [Desulfonema magnum]